MPREYSVFFASGSKGNEVRADGNGSFLKRGYYFRAGGKLRGPFINKRIAEDHCGEEAYRAGPSYERTHAETA